jgi:hypothetical protein
MRRGLCATAIVTTLVVVAGCGGSSSSGDAPRPPASDSAATKEMAGAPKPERTNRRSNRATPARPDAKAKKRGADVQVPLGVPLDARSPRVRRAIATLLHPDGENRGGSGRGNSQRGGQGQRRGALGLLDQIRAAARERLDQPQGTHPQRSERGGALHILEMLR